MTTPELVGGLRAWLDVHEPKLSLMRTYIVLSCIAILDGTELITPTVREQKKVT